MLTKRHLAVLRAALQFFDEELTPHGSAAVQPYFDEPLSPVLKPQETHQLRDFLRTCELRYVGYDPIASQLVAPELTTTLEEALALAATRNCLPAALLYVPVD